LSCGTDPNARDNRGMTPLHYAVDMESADVVKILIEHGADVNTQDNSGRTPLHIATASNYDRMIRLLIRHGADVCIKNASGETPLDIAIRQRSCFAVLALLETKHVHKCVTDQRRST